MRTLNGQDRPREQKSQRANVLTGSQRFTVRVALATGATLAALMGVQTLALQEQTAYAAVDTTTNNSQAALVTSGSSAAQSAQSVSQPAVVEATAVPTLVPTVVVQPTAQPTTAAVTVTTTTSTQPQPATKSSR